MPTLRWHAASAVTLAAPPTLRVHSITVDGAGPVTPKLRVFTVTGIGTSAPVLMPIDSITSEPFTDVPLTVALAPGSSTPDSYAWRVVSGTAILSGTGATITCTTPTPLPPNPATVVVGVVGIKDGFSSPEVTCTLTVLPSLRFTYQAGRWVGCKSVVLV